MAKRPEAHKIDDKAKGIFSAQCPENWVLNSLSNDYGIDYHVDVFDDEDNSTKLVFHVQLKGQRSVKVDNDKIKFVYKTDRLKDHVTKHVLPVFLVLVDITNEEIYWLFFTKIC